MTDINEELKLYIRQKERLKQLQRATIFKPNTRGDEEVIIKGIEDVIPIARRINQVFYETQDKHPITNIPINSKDNPIFHLLVPLGRDDAANGIASGEEVKGIDVVGIDDMQIIEFLITGGGFDVNPLFASHEARKGLAKIYWKAQIEDKPLFEVLEQEVGEADYLSIREMFPNYGLTHSMSKQFENNNSDHPERALTDMFAIGVKLATELYDNVDPEVLNRVYEKSKATPEGDLKKLNTFLKAARYRLLSPSVKARLYRNVRRAKNHEPAVEEVERIARENQEWKSRYNVDFVGEFVGLDEDEIEDDQWPAYLEMQTFLALKQVVQGAAVLLPEYGQFAQLPKDSPATFVKAVAPIFEPYLAEQGVNIDLHNLIYPGVDAQGELEDAHEILSSIRRRMGFERKGGRVDIARGVESKFRGFFRKLLEDAKNMGEG